MAPPTFSKANWATRDGRRGTLAELTSRRIPLLYDVCAPQTRRPRFDSLDADPGPGPPGQGQPPTEAGGDV